MRMPEIGAAPRGLAIVIAPIVIIAMLANGKALRKHPLGKHTVAARGLDLFGAETQPAARTMSKNAARVWRRASPLCRPTLPSTSLTCPCSQPSVSFLRNRLYGGLHKT